MATDHWDRVIDPSLGFLGPDLITNCWSPWLFNKVWLYTSGGCCTCCIFVVVVAGGCCTGWDVARGNPAFPVVTEAVEPLLPVWLEVTSSLVSACAIWKMSRLWPIGMCWELKSSILTNLNASKLKCILVLITRQSQSYWLCFEDSTESTSLDLKDRWQSRSPYWQRLVPVYQGLYLTVALSFHIMLPRETESLTSFYFVPFHVCVTHTTQILNVSFVGGTAETHSLVSYRWAV